MVARIISGHSSHGFFLPLLQFLVKNLLPDIQTLPHLQIISGESLPKMLVMCIINVVKDLPPIWLPAPSSRFFVVSVECFLAPIIVS